MLHPYETCLNFSDLLFIYAVPLSIDDIMQEVIKSEEGRTMNSDRIRASLAQLGCDMPSITGIDETYSIGNITHSILSSYII